MNVELRQPIKEPPPSLEQSFSNPVMEKITHSFKQEVIVQHPITNEILLFQDIHRQNMNEGIPTDYVNPDLTHLALSFGSFTSECYGAPAQNWSSLHYAVGGLDAAHNVKIMYGQSEEGPIPVGLLGYDYVHFLQGTEYNAVGLYVEETAVHPDFRGKAGYKGMNIANTLRDVAMGEALQHPQVVMGDIVNPASAGSLGRNIEVDGIEDGAVVFWAGKVIKAPKNYSQKEIEVLRSVANKMGQEYANTFSPELAATYKDGIMQTELYDNNSYGPDSYGNFRRMINENQTKPELARPLNEIVKKYEETGIPHSGILIAFSDKDYINSILEQQTSEIQVMVPAYAYAH